MGPLALILIMLTGGLVQDVPAATEAPDPAEVRPAAVALPDAQIKPRDVYVCEAYAMARSAVVKDWTFLAQLALDLEGPDLVAAEEILDRQEALIRTMGDVLQVCTLAR